MNEEQLQRIEKGFAAATPLSVYNPHGDRALADIMVDLESRTIVPALIAEVRRLRAKHDAVPVEAVRKLRANLSTDGEYSIRRSDGDSMFIGETIMLGTLFEAIDKWLDTQAAQP